MIDILSKRACENDVLTITCTGNLVLQIEAADYDKVTPIMCGGGNSSEECVSTDKTSQVKSSCDGKKACSLAALSSTFGDPCPGMEKYLLVFYFCGKMCVRARACVHVRERERERERET